MKLTYFTCWLLLLAGTLNGQHLKKRGAIGVIPAPVSETVARYLGLEKPSGVLIQGVVPNSTAALIGIQEKDVITTVNGKSIGSPQELIALSQTLVEGDQVAITFFRGKELQSANGTITPRLSEVAEDLDVTLDEFPFQEGYIRTIIKRKKGSARQKQPVVYFIQGVSCMTLGYLPSVDAYRYATDLLARKGYAVYMVEKPGMGDSQGTAPCSEIGFDTELAAFQKGYDKLLTYDWADKDNIFIFGHSMGGIVAPLLAEHYKPKGVVVYGTVLRTWSDYMVDILRDQRTLHGLDFAEANADLKNFREVFHQYFFNKKTPDQLISENPAAKQQFTDMLHYDGKGHILGRHVSYWQELNDKNLYRAWKNTDAHVLAIYGEADVAAMKPDDHIQIANLINRYHAGRGEYWFAPKTDHGLIEVGSMQEGIQLQASPDYGKLIREKFNAGLFEKIEGWMREKMVKG